MSLMDLPWGVLVCLLREWLEMEDVARLDTAMSCREGREKLLEVLGSGEVCYQGSIDADDKLKASQVKWVGLRGVSLLGLSVDSDVTPEMLLSVTRNSPGLHLISLDGVTGLSAAQMSEIGQSCPKVEELYFFRMQNTDAIVTEAANHMHALKRVELKHCADVGNAALIALSQQCPHLKAFYFDQLGQGIAHGVTQEGVATLAQGCLSLEHIVLFGVMSFPGAALRTIADNCVSLKVLRVALIDTEPLTISDDDLVYFSLRCTMTTCLELHMAHLITDAAVTKMVQYLSHLTELFLEEFLLITDDAVSAIAKYLPNLTKFTLSTNNNITDASMIKVAESCTNLTELFLFRCNQITDVSMIKVAESCKELTDLNLSFCSEFSDASMVKIAESCTKLTNLTLCESNQITDATLDKLGECCPLLEKFMCLGSPLVTGDAGTRLRQRIPKISYFQARLTFGADDGVILPPHPPFDEFGDAAADGDIQMLFDMLLPQPQGH